MIQIAQERTLGEQKEGRRRAKRRQVYDEPKASERKAEIDYTKCTTSQWGARRDEKAIIPSVGRARRNQSTSQKGSRNSEKKLEYQGRDEPKGSQTTSQKGGLTTLQK